MNMSIGTDDPVRPNTALLETVRRGRCPRSEASTLGVHRPAAPAGAESPRLPLHKGGVTAKGRDGGIVKTGRVEPRPYNRLPYLRLVLTRHSEPVTDVTGVGIRSPFLCLRRPLFFQQRKKRGKETPPKTTFLDFLCAPSPAAYLDRIYHANAVPSKFHLNVALSLLLFPLPLLL